MEIEINGVSIEIRKSWYNKTKVQPDGVTHIVDTEPRTVYQFGMAKNYFDIDNREDLINSLVSDLKSIVSQLEKQIIDKDIDRNL